MYGMANLAVKELVPGAHGAESWTRICKAAGLDDANFSSLQKYPDEAAEPFRHADSKIANSYGGMGLGLAIVQRLARLHGGGVAMENEPGVGATVRVRLPCGRVVG